MSVDLYSAYSATYVERDLWELVKVMDLRKFKTFICLLAGQPVNLSFYRDKTGLVIDLIREFQRRPYAIEIKAGTTFVPIWSVL